MVFARCRFAIHMRQKYDFDDGILVWVSWWNNGIVSYLAIYSDDIMIHPRRHVTDFYMDNYVAVAFCKVCSAEGERLEDDCQGLPLVFCFEGTKEEFDIKYGKRLD